jgi:hypothetical protein
MALGAAEVADKMSKIRFTGGFSEDEKKFIANMAEMGPGGTYTLKVDGKDMGIDQAMDLFSKDKNRFNEFMKASEPKTMEDLAKDQLDTIKSIQAAVNSMMNRTPIAASGSKVGESILGGYREAYNIPARALSGNAFDTETMRNKFDDFGSGIGDLVDKMKKGTISGDDFTTAFSDAMKGFSGYLKDELLSALNNVTNGDANLRGEKDVKVKAKDFILETHPMDSILFTPEMMVGGTNLFGGQQNSMSETKNTNDININVTLTSNGADLNQMTKREILEPLVAHIQKVITGDGLLNKNGSTPNPIVNYQY